MSLRHAFRGALVLASLARLAPAQPAAYTTAQAERGRAVYDASCASCHGRALEGVSAPTLGAAFVASWGRRGLTADDLLFVVGTTMPRGASQKLAAREVADVVAYLLARNGFAAGRTELGADRAALRALRIAPPGGMRGDGSARVASAAAPTGRPLAVPVADTPTRAPTSALVAQRDLSAADRDASNWLVATHDYAGRRYSPAAEITSANAGQLRAVCAYQVGQTGAGTFQTIPVVYAGTMYVTTVSSTIALDARTCRPRWTHEWKLDGIRFVPNNRGVAVKDGRVVRGTLDGNLVALDAATGAELWHRKVADTDKGEVFTMPPLVYDDLVFIGPAGSENAIRGWVGAFRLSDGAPVWRFDVIPDRRTWVGPDSIPIGGGATWTPFTLDEATGTLFVATTNPAPDFALSVRQGDNLYSNSVVALDARTGALRWHKQTVPNDDHDWDVTHAGPLYTTTIGGQTRDVVATAGKDGLLRALDRRTQAELWSAPVTTRENVEAPVTVQGTHACPGVLGGVEWSGPAYSERTNMIYVNAVDWCSTFKLAETIRHVPGQVYLGGTVQPDAPPKWGGWLTAVDAATGEVRWRYRSPMPMLAGVVATAGDVVVTGELTGDVVAFDARTGAERWRFNTGGPIAGGVVTYAVDGKQYVAVASGRPSGLFVSEQVGSPTVFVFALP
ncbi:Pyrrolo-quinoline quinone repeat-containing protein [Gemmatirosa kalamazoonensis]|uniref:Pyrrolo-quinoline quinone repeat-containing protein n=1 Tax=Gemmatirosa kalamazoonensis TaxID=861299 RepID=W0RIV9_9BACT|nr:PQQ-binding-like beta-propeller repeat protein [Gemmatirosa kalamazoonensis]AHG90260.1 Pyrrolo-quinoline quinone repeat-containing protein [Gemmatirosa kalamazoonensis]